MNAVHGSILENLRLVEIVYEKTVDAFKGDRTNTSDSKEITVNEFIQSYLPADFQVKVRSKIYSRTQETNNIDCVVLAPNHPKLITPKREVILAEGVFCAIEVKPDISTLTEKSEFLRGLIQMKSIKKIDRKVERIDMSALTGEPKPPKYYDKIPCGIFASKSSSIERTVSFVKKMIKEDKIGNEELPDLIVCLDKGVIFYSPFLNTLEFTKQIAKKGLSIPEKGFLTFESDDKSENLITFLKLFFNFNMPTLQLSEFIVKSYINEINTNNKLKVYPL